jgi:serine/threonine-protein kinase SRPK3
VEIDLIMLAGRPSLSHLRTRLRSPRHSLHRRLSAPGLNPHIPVQKTFSTYNSRQNSSDKTAASSDTSWYYRFIEDVELFGRYCVGGYYPVQIGDEFSSSRYCIVHKLGYGGHSTIWLARDEHLSKYVAIKVGVSNLEPPFESAILKILRGDKKGEEQKHAGMAMIPEMLDEFEVEKPEMKGVKGTHHCLVAEVAKMSVAEAREAGNKRLFWLDVAHAIVTQLVQAIAFMHSRGVVHGGERLRYHHISRLLLTTCLDLHEANILFRLPNSIDNTTPDQLYEKYGQPELEPITRSDGQPLDAWVLSHGILPIWFGERSYTIPLPNSRIFLIDFGESFRPSIFPSESRTPLHLGAPELLLSPSSPVTFASEIWSLACTIFFVMGQRPLFGSWFPIENVNLEWQR